MKSRWRKHVELIKKWLSTKEWYLEKRMKKASQATKLQGNRLPENAKKSASTSSEDENSQYSGSSDDDYSDPENSILSEEARESENHEEYGGIDAIEADYDDEESGDNNGVYAEDEKDELNEKHIAECWKRSAYAESTRGEFSRLYKRLLTWIRNLDPELRSSCCSMNRSNEPEKPFSRALCVRYMHAESKRMTKWISGPHPKRCLGGGTLINVYRMLMHYGFDDDDELTKCPETLKTSLLHCVKAHKRKLPNLMNEGKHPKGALSDAIPWECTDEILRYLHGVDSKQRIDFRLHMYCLHLVQGLYRQQACGHAGFACFQHADTQDCITSNVSGGKCDMSGDLSYAKRLACNFDEPHHCFVSAFARHVFSRSPQETSPFLYMTNEDKNRYDQQLSDIKKKSANQDRPIRIRGNGPHTKFRVHFKRALQRCNLNGIQSKSVTLHSLKRVGYRKLKRLIGIESQDISIRAEHRSSLAYVYGARAASRVIKPGGGPDDRRDMSMAKYLANRSSKTEQFNQNPPHFTQDFIDTIPFADIVPCIDSLPDNILKLLPFLLAQLINHYHEEKGFKLLGTDNPLHMSPLWNEPKWIIYRHTLFENLKGGRRSESEMKYQLRDEYCDNFLMKKTILEAQAALMELMENPVLKIEADKIRKLLRDICDDDANVKRIVTNDGALMKPGHTVAVFNKPIHNEHISDNLGPKLHGNDQQVVITSETDRQESEMKNIEKNEASIIKLKQAAPAFRVPETLDVRTTWFKMFSMGNDKCGCWYSKTSQDIDPSITGSERKNMRDHFNKAKKVIEMMMGKNTIEDIMYVGTEEAFQLSKEKTKEVWGRDILSSTGSEFKAVRSVYNIMCGKGTDIPESQCNINWNECLNRAWKHPKNLKQSTIKFTKHIDSMNFGPTSVTEVEAVEIERNHVSAKSTNISDEPKDKEFDDDEVLNIEQTECKEIESRVVLCFLCSECQKKRLFPTFARYLAHWKQHRKTEGKHVFQKPMEDEVLRMWGEKCNDASTSKYEQRSDAFHPKHTTEEKQRYMRKRIIDRRILKKHDKLLIKQQDGSESIVRVLDPTLIKKYGEWCVKSVIYLDQNNHAKLMSPDSIEHCTEVVSIMEILSDDRAFRRKLDFSDNVTIIKDSIKTTAAHITDEYSFTFKLCDQVMLRDLNAQQKYMRVPNVLLSPKDHRLTTIGTQPEGELMTMRFPLIEFNGTQFIEDDYGTNFGRIYPMCILHTLQAFNLEESNRSFYMCLGIATGNDPFKLQCLFRKHAAFLRHHYETFKRYEGSSEAVKILDEVMHKNANVDSNILSWCWPDEFSSFRFIILKSRTNIQVFAEKAITTRTKDVYLRFQNGHYTVLTPVHAIKCFEKSPLKMLHNNCPQLRCPSIKSLIFEEYEDEISYLSCELPGSVPTEEQIEEIWGNASSECGLKIDSVNHKWIEIPEEVSTSAENQMGSMQPKSWQQLQSVLLGAYHENENLLKKERTNRRGLKSPKKCPSLLPNTHPCVFVDAGSEAGAGLCRMMNNPMITHVAGVEIQKAWFNISVKIFKSIRNTCISRKIRMPAITLFNCCMLSEIPQTKYLYSIASIMWMNNYVFDKHPYFTAKEAHRGTSKDVLRAPLSHLPSSDFRRTSLSANAAFFLAKNYQNNTCIAVHNPESFISIWNYRSHSKPIKVQPTWGNSLASVTIISHLQSISISNNCQLPCVTQDIVKQFEELMQKWSASLPIAYQFMEESRLYAQQLQDQEKCMRQREFLLTQGKIDCEGPSCVLSTTKDLESILGHLSEAFDSRNLSIQLLTTLQPLQCLRDEILREYINLIRMECGGDVHLPDHCFDYKNDLKRTSELNDKCKYKFCKDYFLNDGKKNTYIFAVNTGFHWIAVKIDAKKRYIATMCSLQGKMTIEAAVMLKVISSIHSSATTFQHFSVSVPHQMNGTDCGVFCCLFLLFLSQNEIRSETALSYEPFSTARQIRMRIFADIGNRKLTKLETEN